MTRELSLWQSGTKWNLPQEIKSCAQYMSQLFQYFSLTFMAHQETNLVQAPYVKRPGYITSVSNNKINLEPVFLCRISGLRGHCFSNGFFTHVALGFPTFRKTVLPSDKFSFFQWIGTHLNQTHPSWWRRECLSQKHIPQFEPVTWHLIELKMHDIAFCISCNSLTFLPYCWYYGGPG